jgi:hypothetical protein
MNCAWITNQRGQTCIYGCGYALKRDYDERPVRVCTAAPQQPPIPNVGLGDAVESLLASIGVTQDRYKAAKELFGLPPNCGCTLRKEWLNKVSDWWNKEKT